jgi:hypothetical protein
MMACAKTVMRTAIEVCQIPLFMYHMINDHAQSLGSIVAVVDAVKGAARDAARDAADEATVEGSSVLTVTTVPTTLASGKCSDPVALN